MTMVDRRLESVPDFVSKANMALADLAAGGQLVREQVQNYIVDEIVDGDLMGLITARVMGRDQLEYPIMTTLGNDVVHPAQEGQELPVAQRSAPGYSNTQFTAVEFMAQMRYPEHYLEIQVEGPSIANTIMQYLFRHIAQRNEDLLANGDTVAGATPFLRQFNGLRAGITTNTYTGGTVALSSQILREIHYTCPKQYRKAHKGRMAYVTAEETVDDYGNELRQRGTAVGDQYQIDEWGSFLPFKRVPVREGALFPNTLGVGGNETELVYGDLKMFLVGIRAPMRVEREWDPGTRSFNVYAWYWMTQGYIQEERMVLADGLLAAV